MAQLVRRRFGSRLLFVCASLVLVGLVAGLAIETAAGQRRAVHEVQERFEDRIRLATTYVHATLDEMRHRQVSYADARLTGPRITAGDVDSARLSMGLVTAALLDDDGVLIAISPRKSGLIGTQMAANYEHLAAAVAGRDAVSNVVISATTGQPIIAVAVPFDTGSGRRVLSGGYPIESTPLATFLAATSSLEGSTMYLVDAVDQVVASSDGISTGALERSAPALVGAAPGARTMLYEGQAHFVVAVSVAGTSWRLVASVPETELLAPIRNGSRTLWALVAASAAMALAVLALLWGVVRQRDRLGRVSRTDALTGLANRGRADEVMARAAATSVRTARPWAVAVIDIDRFKSVNDRLGHAGGDRVLCHVATVLAQQTRTSDFCARWGGEEFVIVMEGADLAAAVLVSERLAAAVRRTPTSDGVSVTISVGTASAVGGGVEALMSRADRALYDAKHAGRDRVVAAIVSDHVGV